MPVLDYIVVGAGPAGLQMGRFLQDAGYRYLVLDGAPAAGSFFARFPRHRTLLSFNKVHNVFPEPDFNLRYDWNSLLSDDPDLLFRNFSRDLYPNADDLCRYLRVFADRTRVQIAFDSPVSQISRDAEGFRVETTTGRVHRSRRVLMATGATTPRIPADIEGIENAVGYEDHDLDPTAYAGAKVAIIGRGNSAFEVANHLAGHAAIIHLMVGRPVRHAWHTHFPGDLRSINNTILDMYQLKALHATIGFRPRSITARPGGGFRVVVTEDYPHWSVPGTGQVTLNYDHVIRCTGWHYVDPTVFHPSCRPEIGQDGKFPVLDATWQTSVPGLFYLGTAMQARDRKAASSFIHGFRYNIRTMFHLLEERYDHRPLPRHEFALKTEVDLHHLAEHLIQRVSTTSALYQQFGILCDAIAIGDGHAEIYPELPTDLVLQREGFRDRRDLILLTLEYGFHKYPAGVDPLTFIHPADPARPECSAFLHPVFRWYRNGVLRKELNLTESLVVRYDVYDYEENFGANHLNRVKNLINCVAPVTPSTFVERSYSPDGQATAFRAWTPEERAQSGASAAGRPGDGGAAECAYRNVPFGSPSSAVPAAAASAVAP
jgi:thioredoxin reductase